MLYPKIKTHKWIIPSGTPAGVINYEYSGDKDIEFKDSVACTQMDIYIPSGVDNASALKIQNNSNEVLLDYINLSYIKSIAGLPTDNIIRKMSFETGKRTFTFTLDLKTSPVADIEIYFLFFLK